MQIKFTKIGILLIGFMNSRLGIWFRFESRVDAEDLRSLILGLWSCEISNMISNVIINVIDHVIRSQSHRSTSQIYTKIFL